MRIAIISWSRRKVGGAEAYLSGIIPELLRVGHSVAFWHEIDEPADRARIPLPDGVPAWCVSDLGAQRALAALRDWHPDVIYAHGLHNPELEAETLHIAPVVFFAHAYHGTCISGAKTFKNPIVTPCSRRFGWECLVHYYPHRCGGWSPVTMVKDFQRQSDRLEILRDCEAIIANSNHIRAEYLKHGFDPARVYTIMPFIHHANDLSHRNGEFRRCDGATVTSGTVQAGSGIGAGRTTPYHLLFLGRMDQLKGGGILLKALPVVRAALKRPLRVTFAGDGPERQRWKEKAIGLQASNEGLSIEFIGWVTSGRLDHLWADCDLLVLPSLWPEPFGLVGLEAGSRGIPVAAFAVGGVADWLTDGMNGYLAPGDPPTVPGLAEAIIKCLRDPSVYARLKLGAAQAAQRFSLESHLASLGKVFETVLRCK